MGAQHHECEASCFGHAVAARLYDLHPVHKAESIAKALNCTPTAAENLLAGHLGARSITRLTMAYGLGFLIDAGAAVTGKSLRDHITQQAAAAVRSKSEQRIGSVNSWSWSKAFRLVGLSAQARIGGILSRMADPVAAYGRTLRLSAEQRMKEL
jgi:hypothetical protein